VTLNEMFDQMDLYGFEDFEDSQKLLLLNESYLDIVTREPWPFLEKVVEFVIPTGVDRITIDSEFRVRDADAFLDNSLTDADNVPQLFPHKTYRLSSVLSFINLTQDIVMTPERGDVVEKNYRLLDSTVTPSTYYFVGDDFFLYPVSTSNDLFRLFFLQTPVATTIALGTDDYLLPKRHHSLIVYGALVKAFLVNDDPQAAIFQNAFESRYQQMRNDIWMNQYDRTDRIHIMSDSYDWSY
jgi:hypothetical protein